MAKKKMCLWEKKAFLDGASVIIGVDEAGRGPLAGPVVAAAVTMNPHPLKKFILPHYKQRVDDSKKLLPNQRRRAFREISERAVFGIGLEDHEFIDRKNIHRATLSAMRQAVSSLIKEYCRRNNKKEKEIRKDVCVLIDGNMKPRLPYRMIRILKGDSRSISIAAASIVAKVMRDEIMVSYDKRFPQYGFSRHKGYGTSLHLETIGKHGPCPIHRKSFAPIANKRK